MGVTFNPLSGQFDFVTTSSEVDHGLLIGLSDDDHSQYALLAGRSGGQTLIGGTAASQNLTLQSTSNATRGQVIVSDELLANGFGYFEAGMYSVDGLGGTDSEAYGSGAATFGLDRSLVIGPRASNSGAATGDSMSIGVDAISSDNSIAIGNDSSSGLDSIVMGNGASTSNSGSIVIGMGASGALIDVVIGNDAIGSGIGQNVVIGGQASCSGSSSVALGYNATDGGFSNSFAMGANASCTAASQFVFGLNPTQFFLGRVTAASPTSISAKTIAVGDRTGSNTAGTGNLTIRSGLGTGTGTRSRIVFQTPVVAASGTTPHTLADRLRLTETEAVFNEDSQDTDFRIECDTDTHCFFLDAGAGTVSIAASAASDSAKFYVNGKISTSGEMEINGDLNHDGSNVGFFGTAPAARSTGWSTSNSTTTKTIDVSTAGISDIANVLATLIDQLKTHGLLGA